MNDDLHSIAQEPNDIVRIERITHHIQRIREDQHAMRAAIERMSEAVTRVAGTGALTTHNDGNYTYFCGHLVE